MPALAAQHIQPTWCVLDPPRAGADRKVLEALERDETRRPSRGAWAAAGLAARALVG